MTTTVKQSDFTHLSKHYANRPGYSEAVLDALSDLVGAKLSGGYQVADVGAGTGKLTEQLAARGLNIWAVEPNDAMREEGMKAVGKDNVMWSKGTGEETGLPSSSVNWLLMASSFHWTDPNRSLPEFARVLKPGGYFTALWNPRDIERSELHSRIERRIYEIAPHIKRVSSGGAQYTQTMFDTMVSTGHFAEAVMMEGRYEVKMTRSRYIDAWRSVNDIQAQAGPALFEEIIRCIEKETSGLKEICVPYRTRSWTSQLVKKS